MRTLARSLAVAALLALTAWPAGAQSRFVWHGWDEGLQEARRSGRPVLVDVYTDWCGWCKRMDRDVYSRPDVREYLSTHYVTIKLNAESGDAARYENRSFTSGSLAERFRVTSYPTTVFLNAEGGHVINVPGYVPPERFLLVLRYVGEGHMERGVEWEAFVKQNSGEH
jgi:thioredoxin-related protein